MFQRITVIMIDLIRVYQLKLTGRLNEHSFARVVFKFLTVGQPATHLHVGYLSSDNCAVPSGSLTLSQPRAWVRPSRFLVEDVN